MLTATELKSLLRQHRLRLTKRLGQHHLIDARIAQRLVDACGLSRQDTVVEIGAGLGALTGWLAQGAGRVMAVEVDRGICALLAERMTNRTNVTVICQDIREFSWERAYGALVVGTVPYHITSPILVSLCEERGQIPKAVLVVQREVAQRLIAKPGTKAYGRLSVLGQYGWEISVAFGVPRSAFFPQPAVDSCCVRLLSRVHPPVRVDDEQRFFEVVKAAFSQRRKTLANCLSAQMSLRMSRATAEAILRDLGLPRAIRGEALSLEQFAALANALSHSNPLRAKN